MRRVLILGCLLPACVEPSPTPHELPWSAHAIAASGRHTLILTDRDDMLEAGTVETDGDPVPLPDDPETESPISLVLPTATELTRTEMPTMRATNFVLAPLALAFVSLRAPASARADEPRPDFHLTGGAEVEGAGGIISTSFRGQALVGAQLGHGRFRPSIAAGVVFSDGALYVEDPRAVTGSVAVAYQSVGPVMQLGFHLHDGDDHETAFVFASAAHLYTSTDARLMLDAVPGVTGGSGTGMSASLGVNWARGVAHWVDEGLSHAKESGGAAGLLLFCLPQQLEVTVERDTGSTRTGATFSWGF